MARLLTALDGVPAAVVTNVCAVRLCPVLTPVFRLLVDLQCRRFNAAPARRGRPPPRAGWQPSTPISSRRSPPTRRIFYAADGYHPNDAGYRLWTDYLAPRVLAALADRPVAPQPNLTLAADGGVYAIRNSAVRCPLHPSPLPLNPQDRCARSRDSALGPVTVLGLVARGFTPGDGRKSSAKIRRAHPR